MATMTDEKSVVRDLAKRVAECAAEPRMAAVRQRWRDANELRRPDRAPVLCRPVGCWNEILPPESMTCTDQRLRGLEYALRQILYKRELGDDDVINGTWPVYAQFDITPPNTWGVEIGRHASSEAGGAWAYDPPLKSEADFAKLAMPAYAYNDERTQRSLAEADELLGDILPPRLVCQPPTSATLCTTAANLRGLTEMMLDTLAEPELLHRLMAHLRDACLAAMDAAEASGRLTPNNEGPMFESDPIGEAPGGLFTLANCLCAANSQEFDQVSPALWEEFLLDYQKPIFARYGRVAYGCCENLTTKINGVMSIPNLRIFVCSAWTNMETLLDRIGQRYCVMWRHKASDVVFPDDTAALRAYTEGRAKLLQGTPYQIVLRELQTLAGHPDRLREWTRISIEAAEKYA